MAEYIEKGALMSLIESEAHRWGHDYDWWQCLADIEDFKPADVRPVVRGRWVKKDENSLDGTFYCSNCKEDIDIADGYITPLDLGMYYCPNCGADMREGEKKA